MGWRENIKLNSYFQNCVWERLFRPNRRITLSAGEEVDEVAVGASGMDVDRVGEVVALLG